MADDDVGRYLTIDGIAGTSANPKHRNSIEILSFSFGGKGLAEVRFVKASDTASPKLLSAVNTGKHFDSAVLESFGRVRESDGASIDLYSPDPVRYSELLKITMTRVYVTNYQRTGDLDAFSLVYGKFERTYGIIPAPQKTVQPAHKPLINRLKSS